MEKESRILFQGADPYPLTSVYLFIFEERVISIK